MQEPSPTRGLEVLLVDDSALNRALASHMLERLGCVVRTAASGAEAVALARRTFDAVVMDLHMPGMDGREAALAIHANEREAGKRITPIVVLTADEPLAAAYELWCDAYLTKPVTIEQLDAALRRAVAVPAHEEYERSPDYTNDFIEKAAGDHRAMQDALDQGNYAIIEHIAHGLKNAGIPLRFPAIAEVAAHLQYEARRAAPHRIRSWLDRLDQILSL